MRKLRLQSLLEITNGLPVVWSDNLFQRYLATSRPIPYRIDEWNVRDFVRRELDEIRA